MLHVAGHLGRVVAAGLDVDAESGHGTILTLAVLAALGWRATAVTRFPDYQPRMSDASCR
jgi:hypothetical protein